MRHATKLLLLSAAVLSLPFAALQARADTVTTQTTTEQAPPPLGGKTINMSAFDLNKDGILSTFEVGEMLFKYFDTDANGTIDAAEYERKSIITVVPMEKETVVTYDYNNDGVGDATQHTFQTFLQDTQLARFDKNKDGLSPHDFITKLYADNDSDHNGGIDVTEWRNAYISRIAPVPGQ